MDRADYYKYKVRLMRDNSNDDDDYYVQEVSESIVNDSPKKITKTVMSKLKKILRQKIKK